MAIDLNTHFKSIPALDRGTTENVTLWLRGDDRPARQKALTRDQKGVLTCFVHSVLIYDLPQVAAASDAAFSPDPLPLRWTIGSESRHLLVRELCNRTFGADWAGQDPAEVDISERKLHALVSQFADGSTFPLRTTASSTRETTADEMFSEPHRCAHLWFELWQSNFARLVRPVVARRVAGQVSVAPWALSGPLRAFYSSLPRGSNLWNCHPNWMRIFIALMASTDFQRSAAYEELVGARSLDDVVLSLGGGLVNGRLHDRSSDRLFSKERSGAAEWLVEMLHERLVELDVERRMLVPTEAAHLVLEDLAPILDLETGYRFMTWKGDDAADIMTGADTSRTEDMVSDLRNLFDAAADIGLRLGAYRSDENK